LLPDNGEIQPASIDQIMRGKNGKFVQIEDDVGNVARDIKAIDKRLCVRYSEAGEYFVVYAREEWMPPGDGYLVTTAQELDGRLVDRLRRVAHHSYNFADEVDRIDDEYDRQHEKRRKEQVGEIAERLSHAMRKELGLDKGRAFIG
jgi:hypothetical protein